MAGALVSTGTPGWARRNRKLSRFSRRGEPTAEQLEPDLLLALWRSASAASSKGAGLAAGSGGRGAGSACCRDWAKTAPAGGRRRLRLDCEAARWNWKRLAARASGQSAAGGWDVVVEKEGAPSCAAQQRRWARDCSLSSLGRRSGRRSGPGSGRAAASRASGERCASRRPS